MQRKTAMVALSLGWLAGCGPHDVDLGGGPAGTGDEPGMGTGIAGTGPFGSGASGASGGPAGTGDEPGTGTGIAGTGPFGSGGSGGGYATGGSGGDLGEPAGMGAVGGQVSTGGGPAMGGQAGSTNEQLCGDGIVEYPEICDDGNAVDGDSCASDCLTYCMDTSCVGSAGGSGGTGLGGGPVMGGSGGRSGSGGTGEMCASIEVSPIGDCVDYETLVARAVSDCEEGGSTLRTLNFASCTESASYALCCSGAAGAGTGGATDTGGASMGAMAGTGG